MALVLDPGALLNALSGVLLIGLGAGLYLVDRRLRVNVAIGAFAMAWGLQVVMANLPQLTTSEALARAGAASSVAFLLVLPLLFIATLHYGLGDGSRVIRVGIVASAGAALLGAGVILARPHALLGEVVQPTATAYQASWGPLIPWLVSFPFTIVILLGLAALQRRREGAISAGQRSRTSVFLGATLVYAAYRYPNAVLFYLAIGATDGFTTRGLGEVIVSTLGTLVVAAFLVHLVQERRRAVDAAHRRETGLLVLAIVVPAIVATVGLTPVVVGESVIFFAGVFRLVMVGLLVWGVARFQLLTLDIRLKRHSAAVGALLTPFVVAPVVSPVAGSLGASPAVVALAASAIAVPLALAARTIIGGTGHAHGDAGRASLLYAEAIRAGVRGLELETLQERLGVDPDDRDRIREALTGGPQRPHAPTTEPAAGDVLFETYRVERTLGSTPHGPTVLATDVLLDRPVVLKPLGPLPEDPDARSRVLREGRVAARLDHPRIVEVYTVERSRGHLFLVTEFVPGGDLRSRVERDGPLDPDEAVALAADVLDALERVHAEGVVHRDVTPGNVFLATDGRAKLGDFGLAGARDAPADGHRTGTLATASPEQLTAAGVDARSDLYAAGALVYWALTGRAYVPLEGRSLGQAVELVRTGAPMLPLDLPEPVVHVNDVLARALAKDPADRFPNAASMRAALAGHDQVADPDGPGGPVGHGGYEAVSTVA